MDSSARLRLPLLISLIACLLLAAEASAASDAHIPVTFTLEEPGYVTLVIDDSHGRRVNNLIADTFFEAGTHTVYWDGYDVGKKLDKKENFDVHRNRVEPGQYTVRGLMHDELSLSYQVSVQSPGRLPWHTPDRTGAWLADHTPPVDCLYLPGGSPHGNQPQVMVSAPTGEAGHSTIWLDLDGNKLFGAKIRGWNSGIVNARDEGEHALSEYYAYSLIRGEIFGLRKDITDGTLYDRLVRLDVPEPPENGLNWLDRIIFTDMAIRNGLAAISVMESDAILLVDLHRKKQFGRISIKSPRGLTYDSQGRLYVVSDASMLRFDQPDLAKTQLGENTALINNLQEPGRVRIGPDGEILVTVKGKRHQILVYDAQGRLLRTIGKPGGLQFGLYDEKRMVRPSGMTIDGRGKLWVAEADYAPKRISRWNFATGEFDKAWYGPPKYGGGGLLDPRDLTRFYYSSGTQGIEFEVDWKNNTNLPPRSIYWHKDLSFGRCPGTAVHLDGRKYLINRFFGSAYYQEPDNHVYLWNEAEGKAEFAAVVGGYDRKGIKPVLDRFMQQDQELAAKFQAFAEKAGNTRTIFVVWSDLNRDLFAQADEVQLRNVEGRPFGKPAIRSDFSVVVSSGLYIPPPVEFTDEGVPVWDLSQAKLCTEGYHVTLGDVLMADDGTIIFTMGNYAGPRVMSAFRGRELMWKINGWRRRIAEHPGQLINAQRCIGFPFTPVEGEGGQMFILNGYHGSLYLVTTDGLIITDLGGDERTKPSLSYPQKHRGMIVKDVSFKGEHFWPASLQAEDGTVYVIAGKECSSVFELIGLDKIRRLAPATFSVSAADVANLPEVKVVPGDLRYEDKTAQVVRPEAAPKLDGDLSDWKNADWMSIDERLDAQAAVMMHNGTLYAAWRTKDPKLLNNDAADGWQYMFATGGGLDLMLRTDFAVPRGRRAGLHSSVAAGDIRILVTRINDPLNGPVRAVRFQQTGGTGERVNYTSPVGAVQFDSVKDISGRVQLAQQNGNYELAIPLAVLGIDKIEPGTSTLGDIGILTGDGSDTKARIYWNNKAAQMTTDIPSEARLMPDEWGTWEF